MNATEVSKAKLEPLRAFLEARGAYELVMADLQDECSHAFETDDTAIVPKTGLSAAYCKACERLFYPSQGCTKACCT